MSKNFILPVRPVTHPNYGSFGQNLCVIPEEREVVNFATGSSSNVPSIFTINKSDRSSGSSINSIEDNDAVNERNLSNSSLKIVMLVAIPSVFLFILSVYAYAKKNKEDEPLSMDMLRGFPLLTPTHMTLHAFRVATSLLGKQESKTFSLQFFE